MGHVLSFKIEFSLHSNWHVGDHQGDKSPIATPIKVVLHRIAEIAMVGQIYPKWHGDLDGTESTCIYIYIDIHLQILEKNKMTSLLYKKMT